MFVECRLRKPCRSLTQGHGSALKPAIWPWSISLGVWWSISHPWDWWLSGLCSDSQTPIVCAHVCRCSWRPEAGSLEMELQAVVSCSTWVLGTKPCRDNLPCTVWKHYLSIKTWWPTSKRQEVECGSSSREIGTLGDRGGRVIPDTKGIGQMKWRRAS